LSYSRIKSTSQNHYYISQEEISGKNTASFTQKVSLLLEKFPERFEGHFIEA
jgi:hypothetical protein